MKLEDYTFYSRILPKGSTWDLVQEGNKTIASKDNIRIEFIFDITAKPQKKWELDNVIIFEECPGFKRRKLSIYNENSFNFNKALIYKITEDLGPQLYVGHKGHIYVKAQTRSKYPADSESVNLPPDPYSQKEGANDQ